uniref:Dynactin subunit 5 n=1 Tax=Paramoeba aestuarina TaxID=180227 RepID=A0A7S4KMN9_9EUKA|mmetsp:Transcript_21851/g.33964  ORF Transcript_21851/g.33964 Transcript_21851/m.33964 type:complete len:257 (+) Transcript_21851:80-850(+)|eukprot:CAMPEP_0201539172 /NCGR_PEP_ID=MMETSP0161_2-20130828/69660_1 /ASSEMBLY_ACC=CAM_ASM_000251 /TAXON_ID=180227 /ORGANISM="Neoparamoeba aestuarina, Strain SoJaBio B1-5/56/2" /LENGTH=256 /DNA_ID=CAMNT_0047946393 /DNA_START=69 /DNA_END=839 /DNA_ORIENTATION=-
MEEFPASAEKFYITTSTGNLVSRKSVLCDPQRIRLGGKTIIEDDATLRGDLARVTVGKYCLIGRQTVIRPPFKNISGGLVFFPMKIGDYVTIGEQTVLSAAVVEDNVRIGKDCIIGKRCVLKASCEIADGTILPPDTTVPSFTKYGGHPGTVIGELPESFAKMQEQIAVQRYNNLPKSASSSSSSRPSSGRSSAASSSSRSSAATGRASARMSASTSSVRSSSSSSSARRAAAPSSSSASASSASVSGPSSAEMKE